jgi:hypothetical protein
VVHQSVLTVLQCAAKPVEGWCDMDKNKRSAQTDTGAVDINDIKKRKMIKAVTQSEFSDMPARLWPPNERS